MIKSIDKTSLAYDEGFRPQFHFTPEENWLNDPNGLIYYKGEYHLFYQYHPHSTVWGSMHWGHAVSSDLVNWTHLLIALYPDENGQIFSGSGVIDWQNTAGFGVEAMVAIFTHHDPETNKQAQSIAFSLDHGRTWEKYGGNPVIPALPNLRNFRDPKVFWYGSDESGHWVMAVATSSAVLFYTSPDLMNWQASGGFGFGHGSTAGVWETPDLFQLAVDGGPEQRWVLIAGIGDGAPAGGSGVQYFVGDFDGQTFNSENGKELILWLDYGADAYATQSWSDEPQDRRLIISWMNNWTYAERIPTPIWRGAMTLPRELKLVSTAEGIRIAQEPVTELSSLRGQHKSWQQVTLAVNGVFVPDVSGKLVEITAEFKVPDNTVDKFGIRLRTGEDETTEIGYSPKSKNLFLDKGKSGAVSFSEAFPGVHLAPLAVEDGAIRLHIFVDHSSIEVFANDGRVTMTEQIFPTGEDLQIELFASGAAVLVSSLDIYELKAAKFYQSESS